MTHEQMMEISIFDCENEEQLKAKNEKARKYALEEYRLYQAYHNNPLLKEYLEKKKAIEKKINQKYDSLPSHKFVNNMRKYLILSTIIYGLIFIVSFSEDYNGVGSVFLVLTILNILFSMFVIVEDSFVDKVVSYIFPNDKSYDEEKSKLLNDLYKEYFDKGLRLDYCSTPTFCPANYTYYYGLREKFAPNGHKYFVTSQSYRCAVTDSIASDDEWDEEKKEWQYLPCDPQFRCNGCKK